MFEPHIQLSLEAQLAEQSNKLSVMRESVGSSFTLSTSLPICQCLLNNVKQAPIDLSAWAQQQINAGAEPAQAIYWLNQLERQGIFNYHLVVNKIHLLTLEPMRPAGLVDEHTIQTKTKWQLSRFAYMHQLDDRCVFESPLAPFRLWVDSNEALSFIHSLSKPSTIDSIAKALQLDIALVRSYLRLLISAGVVIAEEEQMALPTWEFHDLLFHSRTRLGKHNNACGATFRFKETNVEQLPETKPPMSNEWMELPAPAKGYADRDLPFQALLEKRHSIRTSGNQAITITQLSEFLYRALKPNPIQGANFIGRNYPSGGALYEDEFYLLVNRCEGLEPGIYHYRAKEHVLEVLPYDKQAKEALTLIASRSTLRDTPHDIILLISARFARMAWKYSGMAYAAMLKHIGVLYQTFYLVATAVGLAPCGIGGGNSDLFARMLSIDYYEESTIGEFALNSLPEEQLPKT